MSEAFFRELMQFAAAIGFPACFALCLIYLFHRQQSIAAKQTEILGGLAVHVTEVAERSVSHGQRLDSIHQMLQRGVCRTGRVNE
jgi:hypothetical protein